MKISLAQEGYKSQYLTIISLQLVFTPSALQITLGVGSLILLNMTTKACRELRLILPIRDGFDPFA